MFCAPNSASSKAFQTECGETLPDRILKYMAVQFFLRCRTHDCCQSRGHVNHPCKFWVASRFDAIPVEDDRDVRVRIVGTSVLRLIAGQPVVVRPVSYT